MNGFAALGGGAPNPAMDSGIGGGGFMLVRDAKGNYETIDYREAAPAAAFENMYRDNLQNAVTGGLAVAVPGDLKGLEYLHQNYGVRWLAWRWHIAD